MPRRLLVVVTAPDPEDEFLDGLSSVGSDEVEVLVVAPASDVSLLDWIAGEEAQARAEAKRRANEVAEAAAVAGRVVDARVGDPDPLMAIEDALHTFPADELVIVTRPDEAATWLEKRALSDELERHGLPVTHLVDDDLEGALAAHARKTSNQVYEVARNIARGENPWVVEQAVFLMVAIPAAVVIAIAVVLYYSVG